ncbi:DegT/DnrJ/EryC1/StrS aminotransferase family protein [Akkermansiaceae bacterium]|nr:DegT/DnrJ/EryC1/StrS aminotransferase family protein [Akkermansiaceae bacterium]MDB4290455.1 DegT/DnrJ/EryC1/StrS aminotransferase family protein [bacterium]MDA8960214.1 DegT/DnrJ/EryC1/StrS aminotransferase family protein [Akkermansiaceae bacterium]MDB4258520.1 DegT/DnrJ/EryC1/StrS aminotransferase family protein [Akkermansiaceae bacterium]MDB4268254.1 DegT/DnrJ/EryC1/StrS aminotransferase family protein [Akkermansiaceae bacterium]
MKKIPLFDLNYGVEEEAAVLEVMRAKWISMGPKTAEFEKQFASMHKSQHAIAVANCTAALHLALRACGIGPSDEVIVPSLTFVATASCVRMVGATPVFADVESLNDWTLSLEDFEKKITPNTKAVIPMHFGGFGANMVAICDLAKQHGIRVIEDACHAPLGKRDGQTLGTFGDFGCYSFYSNKNMSTGEGGMTLTQDDELAEQLKLLRAHGMTATAYDREQGKEFYDVVDWGYNYRMDDIRSAIGLAQLAKLEADVEKRGVLARRYRENLSGSDLVSLPFDGYEGFSSNYVMGVLLEKGVRSDVRKALGERGVGTSMHYPPVHQFECYQQFATPLPVTENIGRRELSLPLYFAMTEEDVDYVCEQLSETLS